MAKGIVWVSIQAAGLAKGRTASLLLVHSTSTRRQPETAFASAESLAHQGLNSDIIGNIDAKLYARRVHLVPNSAKVALLVARATAISTQSP